MRNDSSYGVLLSAHVDSGSVVVDVWSTKEWDVTATTGARYAVTPRATVADASPGLRRRSPAPTGSPSTWCARSPGSATRRRCAPTP